MNKLTMLGDSVFDNKKYIGTEEPDVKDQVKKILDEEFASMDLEFLAEDGAVIERMIKYQIPRIPENTSHLCVSIGGNDLLGLTGLLSMNLGEDFQKNLIVLSKVKERFRGDYGRMIGVLDEIKIPYTVFRIYYPGNPDTGLDRVRLSGDMGFTGTEVAVDAFNAVIDEKASSSEYCKGIVAIDRLFMGRHECYANPIEPSRIGGEIIARKVVDILRLNKT